MIYTGAASRCNNWIILRAEFIQAQHWAEEKKLLEIGFAGHSRNASNSPRSEVPENKF